MINTITITKGTKEEREQTLELFRSVEGVEIKPLEIDLAKLSVFLWIKLRVNIDDKELNYMAGQIIEVFK